jgi:ureidoglycolate dehydrogenase (NAD+)
MVGGETFEAEGASRHTKADKRPNVSPRVAFGDSTVSFHLSPLVPLSRPAPPGEGNVPRSSCAGAQGFNAAANATVTGQLQSRRWNENWRSVMKSRATLTATKPSRSQGRRPAKAYSGKRVAANVAASSTTVPAPALAKWAEDCLAASKLSRRDARQIATSLVQTSLWGIDSHGIARLGHYLARIHAGSIKARPKIRVRRTGPCTVQVDGGDGHGMVICHRAMEEAIATAKKNGIGAVGVSNSSHCGAAALYGRQAARAGLIAIAFTHSDAFVAPHGGTKKFLGTNPICITVPTRDPEHPLCLDMATSAVPYNRIVNYRRENRALQTGWALDQLGRPTLDPHAVECLLPLAGHKGYALAFLIDLLCGPLNGMPFGPHIPEMYRRLARRRRLGSFFIAIDPVRFGGGKKLPTVAARMAREARAQPRANPAESVLAPGDPEHQKAAQRTRDGIPVEPGLRLEMERWSKRLGVRAPW